MHEDILSFFAKKENYEFLFVINLLINFIFQEKKIEHVYQC